MYRAKHKELPPLQRKGQFDFLLAVVDGDVVALEAGEDYPAEWTIDDIRPRIFGWAGRRGVRAETRICWWSPDVYDPYDPRAAPPRERPEKPFGLWVRVLSSKNGRET